MWKFKSGDRSEQLPLEAVESSSERCFCCEIMENMSNEAELVEETEDAYERFELRLKLGELVLVLICVVISRFMIEKDFLFPSTYYYLLLVPITSTIFTSIMLIIVLAQRSIPDSMILAFNSFTSVITGSCFGVSLNVWAFDPNSSPVLLSYSIFSVANAFLHLYDTFLKAKSMS